MIDYIPFLNKLRKEKKYEEKFIYIEDHKNLKEISQEKKEEEKESIIIDIL